MILALTGSSGFLGTHIQLYCDEKGYKVITIPHSILSDPSILKYKLRDGFDYLIHGASYGNYYDQTDDFQIVESNIIYIHNLLQATKDIDYKGFINISSSSVYGNKVVPMIELDRVEPETLYASSKASSEMIAHSFALKYKKPVISVRPFTIYGPMDNPKHLIPTIIRSIKEDEHIILDPKPVHDYVYVKDVVNGLFHLKDHGNKSPGDRVNIGTGVQHSNMEVLMLIEKLLKKKSHIVERESMRSYDSLKWVADTTYLSYLGFKPKYNLYDGLKEIII